MGVFMWLQRFVLFGAVLHPVVLGALITLAVNLFIMSKGERMGFSVQRVGLFSLSLSESKPCSLTPIFEDG